MYVLYVLGLGLFIVQTVSLYALPVLATAVAIILIRRSGPGAGIVRIALCNLLIIAAVSPFAYYAYLTFQEKRAIAEVQADLAAFEAHPLRRAERPDAILVKGGEGAAKALVGRGLFRAAYLEQQRNRWRVYTLKQRTGCPVQWDSKQRPQVRGFRIEDCVENHTVAGPPADGRYLVLLLDRHVSLPAVPGVKLVRMAGSLMELRWSPEKGGGVIDRWHTPYFSVLSFPPTVLGPSFRRETWSPEGDLPIHQPNIVEFVARAIGLSPTGR